MMMKGEIPIHVQEKQVEHLLKIQIEIWCSFNFWVKLQSINALVMAKFILRNILQMTKTLQLVTIGQ
jgi:hypothetical protein